jgi:hypothetical protein
MSEDDICGYGKKKPIIDERFRTTSEDWAEADSGLCQHAKRELELAGLFDEDSDYGGMLGRSAYEIVRTFASQGHSGASAEIVTDLVARLMAYQPLTPITTNPDEWIDQSEVSGTPLWQSKRDPSVFSTDGGKTWQGVHTHTIPNG